MQGCLLIALAACIRDMKWSGGIFPRWINPRRRSRDFPFAVLAPACEFCRFFDVLAVVSLQADSFWAGSAASAFEFLQKAHP